MLGEWGGGFVGCTYVPPFCTSLSLYLLFSGVFSLLSAVGYVVVPVCARPCLVTVQDILGCILWSYPHQAMWSLMGLSYSSGTVVDVAV